MASGPHARRSPLTGRRLGLPPLRTVRPPRPRGRRPTPEETDPLADALVVSLEPTDLHRAFASAARLLLKEARHIDAGLASRLASPIEELVRSSDISPQRPSSQRD